MLDVEKYIYLYKKALQCLKLSFSMSRQLRQGSKKKMKFIREGNE